MEIKIRNRPLTSDEKAKFHEYFLEIMHAYEYYTKLKFMRFDVMIMEELVKHATPAQIIAVIKQCSKDEKYGKNFTYFGYIEPHVKRKFKGKRGGKKDE